MNFLEIMKFVLTIIPLVINLIKEIEAAIPGPNLGAEKLDLLQNLVATATDSGSGVPTGLDLPNIVESIAGTTVKALNLAGIFKKATP